VNGRPPLSVDERAARGRAARRNAPRSSHAGWDPAPHRPDPIGLLEEQAAARLPELVPIRYGRMSASPFAFYRGAAYVMASDLGALPSSGIRVQLCGDAHLANFGCFASPERELLFDINDFDETLPGPFEWDVKRLAASIAVAAREHGLGRKQRRTAVRDAIRVYRQAIRQFATMSNLAVWYARIDEGALRSTFLAHVGRREARQFEADLAKGKRKDSSRAFHKLATHASGGARIQPDPPLVEPLRDLMADAEAEELETALRLIFDSYRRSLPAERRHLLDRYRVVDIARKVVGVGSVGTRAWIVLLLGRDECDPLFIQAKEADRSVLEGFTAKCRHDNQGERVVHGQHLMQASSDILLGWLRERGPDGERRDFYLRQLWDWKTSADLDAMDPSAIGPYGQLCAWTLARAHARSGDAVAIGAYLGSRTTFEEAIADFAEAYADQNERDHAVLLEAIRAGRVDATQGI
jgi:uncharacterized protein (DUF2252 family)